MVLEEWSEMCNTAGFEHGGRELGAQECGWLLEARKGKAIDCTLEP